MGAEMSAEERAEVVMHPRYDRERDAAVAATLALIGFTPTDWTADSVTRRANLAASFDAHATAAAAAALAGAAERERVLTKDRDAWRTLFMRATDGDAPPAAPSALERAVLDALDAWRSKRISKQNASEPDHGPWYSAPWHEQRALVEALSTLDASRARPAQREDFEMEIRRTLAGFHADGINPVAFQQAVERVVRIARGLLKGGEA